MNLQASLAFLLSVVAWASGQDHCDSKMEAAAQCLGEDGWATCQLCFESTLEGIDELDVEDFQDEATCGNVMTQYGKAFGQCTKSGSCNVDCTNDLAALIDCSLASECAGHTVNDYMAIT